MGGRLVFANQLRGLAAASVACSHLLGVYWLIRPTVSAATFTPALEGPNSPFVALIVHPWFNLGSFGVGLFFLISGLVIPISLEKHTPGSFLLARALRIYPTYAAALLIEMVVLEANAHYWGRPFDLGLWRIVSNLLLVQDLVGQPSVDLVNWTLSVELRFYIVIALVAGAVRRGSVVALLAIGLAALGLNIAVGAGALGLPQADPPTFSYGVSLDSLFVAFMLVGVVFNYHLRGRLGTGGLVLWVAVLGAIFAGCWHASVLGGQYLGVERNYGCALVLFAALYAVRRWIPGNRVLDGLAAISFPFYLVHSLVGFSVLKLAMMAWGWGYPAALGAAVAVGVLLAAGLHAFVEAPTARMGRRLAPNGTARRRPQPVERGGDVAA